MVMPLYLTILIVHIDLLHQMFQRESECTRTGRCYCTAFDACFDNSVTLWISNCWLIGHDTTSVVIEYTIQNTARLELSGRFSVNTILT